MNILKEMQHNLNGPNNGLYGSSMDRYRNDLYSRPSNLYDNYGHTRGSIDYAGRITDNKGLSYGARLNNDYLYNNLGSQIGYRDSFGNLRNNLGEGLGLKIY